MKRRLEVKAELHGITIIDDFAHHPTAIAETLKAVRTRYPGRRLWAIWSRVLTPCGAVCFRHELAQSLAVADEVVLADVFKSEAIPELRATRSGRRGRGLECRWQAGAAAGRCRRHRRSPSRRSLRPGDVVAILSNGGFGGIYEKLPAKLKSLHEVATTA